MSITLLQVLQLLLVERFYGLHVGIILTQVMVHQPQHSFQNGFDPVKVIEIKIRDIKRHGTLLQWLLDSLDA